MEADRQAALQGRCNDGVFCVASGHADQSHATKERPGVCAGGTSTQTPDAQRRSAAANPSPKKTRSQSSPAKPWGDAASEGPTIADLTAMVQQLRLENRRLEDQLVERKIEVEELWG